MGIRGLPVITERGLRADARRQGLALRKDRARTWSLDHRGGYMVVNPGGNRIIAGEHYDMTLDDVAALLGG
jgi:hypothetical protein